MGEVMSMAPKWMYTHGSVSIKLCSFSLQSAFNIAQTLQWNGHFYTWALCKLIFMVYPTNKMKKKKKHGKNIFWN